PFGLVRSSLPRLCFLFEFFIVGRSPPPLSPLVSLLLPLLFLLPLFISPSSDRRRKESILGPCINSALLTRIVGNLLPTLPTDYQRTAYPRLPLIGRALWRSCGSSGEIHGFTIIPPPVCHAVEVLPHFVPQGHESTWKSLKGCIQSEAVAGNLAPRHSKKTCDIFSAAR
ncbi:hypothetical protein BO85DRAFT_472577, partial [Aspergillus piperis CBS 112811]